MRMDPRCRKLNELSARYHELFTQLTERYLAEECTSAGMEEPLCGGDLTFLYTAGEQKDGVATMAEVAKQLNINPSTATRQVNRLVAAGLATKSAAPHDDRRYEVRLTEKGTMLRDRMETRMFQAVERTYQNVTDEELQTVYRFMEKCIGELKTMRDQG